MIDQLIVLLGPTAVGKTQLAIELAVELDAEIISADSRQVYQKMDIGTGKDLQEYNHPKGRINYHLIDILEAGETYDVFHFQKDFYKKYEEISNQEKQTILCGGTGLYLEAALREKQFIKVPENEALRADLASKDLNELQILLTELKEDLHNSTDLLDKNRIIRAIEIAQYEKKHTAEDSPIKKKVIFGLRMERDKLRENIKDRLDKRLESGMIAEVEALLSAGLSKERLDYYGLEYRYIVRYLVNEMSHDEMYEKLLQAIRRFAKKQMSWFRRMEKQGHVIYWIEADWDLQKKKDFILSKL